MKIIHDGKAHQFDYFEWVSTWREHPERRDSMERIAREGMLTDDDDAPITGAAEKRLRARLLRTYADIASNFGGSIGNGEPRRFLVPGLWPWGTIPALGGNWKAGKSTIVTDLTRTLLIPDYRFLGHFGPADLATEERERGIVVVNAETPAIDFENGIFDSMTDDEWERLNSVVGGDVWAFLKVEHLEELGGANLMDLTDPDIYDLWVSRLAQCMECDGSDDTTPSLVIVDGVTAILQAAGKDTEEFGHWYAAFRRLLRECDIPNGLATGHNTMNGGHLMGGTSASAHPDGLWTYSSDSVDEPNAPRRFSVRPRMGGAVVPKTRVVLNEEGRPVAHHKESGTSEESEPEDFIATVVERVAAYVTEHPGAHGEELTQNVEYGGWKESILRARARAVEEGLIRSEPCKAGCSVCAKPHHKRTHFWPVTTGD